SLNVLPGDLFLRSTTMRRLIPWSPYAATQRFAVRSCQDEAATEPSGVNWAGKGTGTAIRSKKAPMESGRCSQRFAVLESRLLIFARYAAVWRRPTCPGPASLLRLHWRCQPE